MSETKHTPGPWPLVPTGDHKRIVVGKGLVEGPDGYEVAEVYSDDCPSEVAWANARLIGSAPILLNMVKWCVSHDGECLGDHPELLTAAVAAIAEIEGTTP